MERLLAGILSCILLAGCQGGVEEADSVQAVVTEAVTRVARSQFVENVVLLDASENVPGKIDYQFAPIVCNKANPVTSQRITVLPPDPTATVLNGEVALAASSYGQCKLTAGNPLVVRIDKSKPLDLDLLRFSSTEQKSAASNPIEFLKVDLYALRGRTGHEALLALNTQYPRRGQSLQLRVALKGGAGLKATYRIRAADTTIVAEGLLEQSPDTGANVFMAKLVVPAEEFTIQVVAEDAASNRFAWTTDSYYPQATPLALGIDSAVVQAPGATLTGAVTGTAEVSGPVTVKLLLPAGYSGDWYSKTLTVNQGDAINLPFQITAPTPLVSGKFQAFAQYRYQFQRDVLIKAPVFAVVNL